MRLLFSLVNNGRRKKTTAHSQQTSSGEEEEKFSGPCLSCESAIRDSGGDNGGGPVTVQCGSVQIFSLRRVGQRDT